MSRGEDTRFKPGRSGNPAGRPKKPRGHVSAFQVILDKTLTVTQGGVEREFTVDEALRWQTYQAALKGDRTAIRVVLKWIADWDAAKRKRAPAPAFSMATELHYDSDNAVGAMCILGIADWEPAMPGALSAKRQLRLATWVVQAAISRPGSRKLSANTLESIRRFTFEPDKLRWPRGQAS